MTLTMDLIDNATRLKREVARLRFAEPVTHVYNPLTYAWAPHKVYLERFGQAPRAVVLVGMNPGPWGMVQTGVPFGDVQMVRDWLGIEAPVERPAREHPARRVKGFACPRSEVSGRRLWGWAAERFGTPERFFARFFVLNYCPLSFMEVSGRNRTPDKLPPAERRALLKVCNRALARALACLTPEYALGVGQFAAARLREAVDGTAIQTGALPHPSPASPAANRGWSQQMERALDALGVVWR